MTIPKTYKVPGTYVKIDNSRALEGALVEPAKTVIIGQMTSDGTATSGTYEQILSRESAIEKYGRGSMMAEMFSKWYEGNLASEVYGVALPDAPAATAAAQTITVTGAATEAGTVYLYINGEQLQVGVVSGATPTTVASSIETAIGTTTTAEDYPVTAAATSGIVTLTAKNAGTVGNQIEIRQNLVSTETTPTGLTVTIADSVTGATDPDVDDIIAALPDDVLNWIISPYSDTTSVGKITDELDRRWGELVQLDGHAIIAYGGNAATVVSWGDNFNNEHLTVIDSGKNSPVAEYLWAVAFAAPIAYAAEVDAARPFRSLDIVGITGDTPSDKRKQTERNSLLNAGISTHIINDAGDVTIERCVTTYKTNAVGATDDSYQNLNTLTITSFLRQSLINHIETNFPRHKLADDSAPIPVGQAIVTPNVMRGSLYGLYSTWQSLFVVEDFDFFAENLVISRDITDRSRLNIFMRPQYVGQYYISDVTLQFKL